jgi:hypothetical protein
VNSESLNAESGRCHALPVQYNSSMSDNPDEKTLQTQPEQVVASSLDSTELNSNPQLPASAAAEFPVTHKADKVNPPLTMEEKKKVWTKRIIGAIVFFAILGSLAMLAAAQAVSFLFKTILTP